MEEHSPFPSVPSTWYISIAFSFLSDSDFCFGKRCQRCPFRKQSYDRQGDKYQVEEALWVRGPYDEACICVSDLVTEPALFWSVIMQIAIELGWSIERRWCFSNVDCTSVTALDRSLCEHVFLFENKKIIPKGRLSMRRIVHLAKTESCERCPNHLLWSSWPFRSSTHEGKDKLMSKVLSQLPKHLHRGMALHASPQLSSHRLWAVPCSWYDT